MALASEIHDEFLTCNICLEEYKQPKQLPCLHTFCRNCLSRFITNTVKKNGLLSVPCPICRRVCLPPNPDPTKLHQWADQFPSNFFVESLKETVQAGKRGNGDTGRAGPVEDSQADQSASYFMGETNSCSKHLTNCMTHYCVSLSVGICDLCLEEDPHRNCEDRNHLGDTDSRDRAIQLLNECRQQMEQVRQSVAGVKKAFGRKPLRLQRKKEEVEISVADFFSDQRSRCAKFLLTKEREIIDKLAGVVEDESQRSDGCQKECDDILAKISNTMSLFDTLTGSGPFNAMHVLGSMEEQVANFGRVVTKMDQEAKADVVQFRPPSHHPENLLQSIEFGEIVMDFGKGEMIAHDSSTGQEGGELDISVQNLQSRLSELSLQDSAEPSQRNPQHVDVDAPVSATDQDVPAVNTDEVSSPTQISGNFGYASAPPLDYSAPPSYSQVAENNYGLSGTPAPSAPPISSYNSDSEERYSSYTSPALEEADQSPRHKNMSCSRVIVFSGNVPSETRLGGLCGAAMIGQVNRAAFVDRHNHSVKIIDLHLAQIVGYLHLGNREPWDITFNSTTNELVVTCPGPDLLRCLLFIPSTSRTLQIARSVKPLTSYCCLAHIRGEEFAGGTCAPFGQTAVHVFTSNGIILRHILPGVFTYPRTVFCNSSGDLLAISDWTSNFVILVTPQGVEVSRYKDAPSPKGVAISMETKWLHVLDGKWARLHLIDSKGSCVNSVKMEGCRDPRMIVVIPTCSSYFPDTELSVIADGRNALHAMSVFETSSLDDYYDDNYDYEYYQNSASAV